MTGELIPLEIERSASSQFDPEVATRTIELLRSGEFQVADAQEQMREAV